MIGAGFDGGGVRNRLLGGVGELDGAIRKVTATSFTKVPIRITRRSSFCWAALLVEILNRIALWHGGDLCVRRSRGNEACHRQRGGCYVVAEMEAGNAHRYVSFYSLFLQFEVHSGTVSPSTRCELLT